LVQNTTALAAETAVRLAISHRAAHTQIRAGDLRNSPTAVINLQRASAWRDAEPDAAAADSHKHLGESSKE